MEFTKEDRKLIKFVLKNEKNLVPIFNTPNKLPQRVKDFDESVFIVRNLERDRYEIHSLKSYFPRFYDWTTHQADIYFDQLDERVLKYMHSNSIKHNGKELFIELTRENDLMQSEMAKRAKRRIRNSINEVMRTAKGYNNAF